jgi:hypothetical protein
LFLRYDSKADEATERVVGGVRTLSFVSLLDRTEKALPPPKESTAEAPSMYDKSSRSAYLAANTSEEVSCSI